MRVGELSRVLAARGASVVGVDLSAEMLRYARDHAGDALDIDYLVGGCEHPRLVGRVNKFDVVVCNMALMDIDDLDGALATAAGVLTRVTGGSATRCSTPASQVSGLDSSEQLSSWPPERGYGAEGWWTTDGDGVRGRVGANHRTLSTYLNRPCVQASPSRSWSSRRQRWCRGSSAFGVGASRKKLLQAAECRGCSAGAITRSGMGLSCASGGSPTVTSGCRIRTRMPRAFGGRWSDGLPTLVDVDRHADAREVLRCYYALGDHDHSPGFTGRWFDTWDSTGDRAADNNEFTADDLVAVSFLSSWPDRPSRYSDVRTPTPHAYRLSGCPRQRASARGAKQRTRVGCAGLRMELHRAGPDLERRVRAAAGRHDESALLGRVTLRCHRVLTATQ